MAVRRARTVTLAGIRRLMPRRGRAYRVRAVRPEGDGVTTLALEADGHRGAPFEPGQFVRIKAAGAPLEPAAFASSAEHPETPELAVEGALAAVEPGVRVLLDSPHGSLRPPLADAGYVLICVGIGLAPAMSLLRTLADRDDRRTLRLIAANRRWEEVPYRDALAALEQSLRLRVCHVLSEPPPDWEGERGHVDAALLRRSLPADAAERNVVISGPSVIAATTHAELLALGIPEQHIATWCA